MINAVSQRCFVICSLDYYAVVVVVVFFPSRFVFVCLCVFFGSYARLSLVSLYSSISIALMSHCIFCVQSLTGCHLKNCAKIIIIYWVCIYVSMSTHTQYMFAVWCVV